MILQLFFLYKLLGRIPFSTTLIQSKEDAEVLIVRIIMIITNSYYNLIPVMTAKSTEKNQNPGPKIFRRLSKRINWRDQQKHSAHRMLGGSEELGNAIGSACHRSEFPTGSSLRCRQARAVSARGNAPAGRYGTERRQAEGGARRGHRPRLRLSPLPAFVAVWISGFQTWRSCIGTDCRRGQWGTKHIKLTALR